jgi:nicotinate-nucleotide adenylyltransferase
VQVALIGGSFNPPHIGHLIAAHYVRATQPVDEVWLLPSFHHPFGKPMVEFEHRLRMCEALCADASGWLRASDVERQIGRGGWTVDTLEHLRRTRPRDEFTLVIGSDILKDLPSWKDFDRIRALAKVLVIHRAGHPAPEALGPPLVEVSSTDIRAALARGEMPVDRVPRRVLDYVREHGLYRD